MILGDDKQEINTKFKEIYIDIRNMC